MRKNILAMDIGGTSSRFAHFVLEDDSQLVYQGSTWLKTTEARDFSELLVQLRSRNFSLVADKADFVAIAIAGPIEDGNFSSPPLIDWDIDLRNARADFGIQKFALMNDFLAQAFACPTEVGKKAQIVIEGAERLEAPIGVIGAGTGLGKAFLLPNGSSGYVGGSSEGGHTNFCPESDREYEFFKYMVARQGGGYLTWNDVVSGRGLSAIHGFLTSESLEPQAVAARLTEGSETLHWASRFYGRVCRNFALETLCFGGLFIAGGVASKNPILVTHAEFAKAFHDSRPHRHLLEQISVRLNSNEESGLWGAAFFAAQHFSKD